ncbi:MAG TPA: hypothetical protein PK239_15810, partial [Chitinophagales bacterium]|nr:hypothetical protein [Chitinophagales bacterium]
MFFKDLIKHKTVYRYLQGKVPPNLGKPLVLIRQKELLIIHSPKKTAFLGVFWGIEAFFAAWRYLWRYKPTAEDMSPIGR